MFFKMYMIIIQWSFIISNSKYKWFILSHILLLLFPSIEVSHVNIQYDIQLKWRRTKTCLALVWPQHKAKFPGLIHLKTKLKGKKKKKLTFMQRLIILQLSKVRVLSFQRSLRKVPSANIFSDCFHHILKTRDGKQEANQCLLKELYRVFCYSVEVR